MEETHRETKSLESRLDEKSSALEAKNCELSERLTVEALRCVALEQRIENLVENLVGRSGDVDRYALSHFMVLVLT